MNNHAIELTANRNGARDSVAHLERWLGLLPISLLQPLPFRPQNPPAGAECHPSLA
jgi:hypothetical protein